MTMTGNWGKLRRLSGLATIGSAVVVATAVAACGSGSSGGASASGSGSGKTITIGVIAPFTGSYQDDGKENLQGVETAVQQINAQGGIKSLGGAKLKIVSVDATTTGGSAASAAAAQLVSDNPAFVISGPVSAPALPGAPVFERAKIPECTDAFSDKLTSSGYQYMFELPPPGSIIAKGAVPGFLETLSLVAPGATKVAVVYDSNPSQQTLTVPFATALKATGKVKIVYEEEFPLGSTSLAPIAQRIKASGAQVLVPGATNPELEAVLGPLHAAGVANIPIYNPGGGSPSGEDYLAALGKDVNGQFAVVQFNHAANLSAAQNQLLTAANNLYVSKFKTPFMGEFGGEAYTCTWDLALAMERAKSTDGTSIRNALVGFNYTSGPGSLEVPGKVEYNSKGVNTEGGSVLAEWCNSDLVAVGPNQTHTAQAPKKCGL
jgi:branched-chain amino acid transport system substrate-binding protein